MKAFLRPSTLSLSALLLTSFTSLSGGSSRAEELTPSTKPADVPRALAAATPSGSETNAMAGPERLMTGSVLETPAQLGADATDMSALRRRSLRSSMTNLPPVNVSARGGALRFVAIERTPTSFLQLFNPFAPTTLGAGTETVFEWHPGQGVNPAPRAFRDERTHEAEGILLIGTPR